MSEGVRAVASGVVTADRTPYRILALTSAAALIGVFLSLLYRVIQIDGNPTALLVVAVVSVGAATALARVLPVRTAVTAAGVLLVGGLLLYTTSLPYDPVFAKMVASNLELLSGRTILRIEQSGVWALSITPGPVFATWYLAVRRRYASAALAGFAGVGYFVLTGDAGVIPTLLAVLAAAALVGFGDLAARSGSLAAAEALAVVLAVMVVTPLAVSVVPGGAATPLSLDTGTASGSQAGTIEAALVSTDAQVDIVGSISLSPAVRFTIESPQSAYWRVASYDRYTGNSWIRTGSLQSYGDRGLSAPPGETRRVEQRVTAESNIETLPAAWRPVGLSNASAQNPQVATDGSLVPGSALEAGDTYRVVSAVPTAGPAELAAVSGEDPANLATQYTQLPTTTPDRVAERTQAITAGASTRYETARAVESWLLENKAYSLAVERPAGNVADAFLFEMDRGYCVYYATTMVVMLRTQEIPARLAVGYTPGEAVGNDTYRVRGYNSHAWVEVYFPEHGWVDFDPTPAGPRRAAEQALGMETNASDFEAVTPVPIERDQVGGQPTPARGDRSERPTPTATPAGAEAGGTGGFTPPSLPSREQLALGAIVLVGLVAGARRSGLGGRLYRVVWLRWQRRRDPETDVERAYERLAYLLERRYRPRRRGETVRQYLDAVRAKSRERRIAALREQARHGPGVTRAEADTAMRLVDEIRRTERTSVWRGAD